MNEGASMGRTGFFQQQLQMNTRSQYYTQDLKSSKVQSVVSMSGNKQNLIKFWEQYIPNWSDFNIGDLHMSKNLLLKKYKESVYYGEFVNGKRHGMGVMLYNNNRVYQGNWQSNYKHGQGYQKFNNLCIYEGDYVNGKPQGVGKYTWQNGQFYEGEWFNGMKEGSGMWRGAKGDSYIGQWKQGKADGYGVHTWINGDRYEGQFKEYLKHGEGIQKFSNGDFYKGNYVSGKPCGYGEYYWQNGSYFKGEFKNGLRNGQGIWKRGTGNSDKYEGEYVNDKKCGYGVFSWATGNIYKGNYESDVRNGYGEMYWNDGSFYKGKWQNGIQHGQGTISVPGEGVKKGIFENNVLVIVQWQSQGLGGQNIQTQDECVHRVIDPEKCYQSTNSKRANIKANGMQSNKTNFRSRGFSCKNKGIESKIHDEHCSTNKQLRGLDYHNSVPTHKGNNQNYQFLHYKLQAPQQKLIMEHQRVIKPKKSQTKQRILHSSFYMHKLHNRINTNMNNNNRNTEQRCNKEWYKNKKESIGSETRIVSKPKIEYF